MGLLQFNCSVNVLLSPARVIRSWSVLWGPKRNLTDTPVASAHASNSAAAAERSNTLSRGLNVVLEKELQQSDGARKVNRWLTDKADGPPFRTPRIPLHLHPQRILEPYGVIVRRVVAYVRNGSISDITVMP